MTECVNGCCSKPTDGEPPVPRLAVEGLLCRNCYRKLDDWLRDIPVDFALLDLLKMSGGSQRMDGSSRTKQPEAPAPVRLDVLSLSDAGRFRTTAIREPGDELWYELPDIPDVLGILYSWAEDLRCDLDPQRERQDLDARSHFVHQQATYLIRGLPRLSEAPWVDDCMKELHQVWSALTRAHGLVSGESLGDCFTVGCDGKVYRDRFTGFPECRVCHRRYEGMDALKLRLTEEAAG